jgi:cell wall-associated NlpC family hydrolase
VAQKKNSPMVNGFCLLAAVGVLASGGGTTAVVASQGVKARAKAASRAVSSSARAERVVGTAADWRGVRYVFGGDSRTGIDCSALTRRAFRAAGVSLPRVSADQVKRGTAVHGLERARRGDLLGWDNSGRNVGADHVALYAGRDSHGRHVIIEAPRTGIPVRKITLARAGHGTPDYIRRLV